MTLNQEDLIIKRFKVILNTLKMTQTDFSKEINISSGNMSDIMTGRSKPSILTLTRISERFKINIDWLVTGEGEILKTDKQHLIDNSNKVIIPILDIKASAGYGYNNLDHPAVIDNFSIEKHIIKPYAKDRVVIFEVRGDSMQPTFNTGDFVCCAKGIIESNGIYLININGNLLVKRLQFIRKEKILIKSDNKLYDDEEVTPEFTEYFSIIGKVFYRLTRV